MLAEPQGVKALKASLKHNYRQDGTFTSTGDVPQSRFTSKKRAHIVSTGLEGVTYLGFLHTVVKALDHHSSSERRVRKHVHKLSAQLRDTKMPI